MRALAFNGAEVVYRPSEAVPMTQMGMEPGGTWLLQNRAHAHFNNVYMVCPNVGPVYVHPRMEHPYDISGGNSHIVDYQGNVLGHTASGAAEDWRDVLVAGGLANEDRRARLDAELPDQAPLSKNLVMRRDLVGYGVRSS